MERISKEYRKDCVVYTYRVNTQKDVDRIMENTHDGNMFKGYKGIGGGYDIQRREYIIRVLYEKS